MSHFSVLGFAALVLSLAGGSAFAQTSTGQDASGEALIRSLQTCRGVADSAARLTCFDQAAARLLTAEQTGEVVVVDRAQARAARRQAFGFSLPSLDVFKKGEPEAELDRVELTLARASKGPDGKWVMRTTEGQVWRQTDGKTLTRAPEAGQTAEVRNAAMGSFFMNIDGQRAIRVRREQ